jgi:hypothetical protein
MIIQTAPVAYLDCASLLKARNKVCENHWSSYWQEITGQMGYSATRYDSFEHLRRNLSSCRVLFIDEVDVPAVDKESILSWVHHGGILVGSLTFGLDELFGITSGELCYETDDEYTIQAYAAIKENAVSYLPEAAEKSFTLPVISKYRICITQEDVNSLAFLLPPTFCSVSGSHEESGNPAIWERKAGKGQVFYFAFSIPQTLCILHQGRPVDRDWDRDGFYRSGDGIVLTQCHDLENPYADYYLYILQAILDQINMPSIYPLPPKDGKPADLAIHFLGGDACDTMKVQVAAASKMHELDLPYHVNIMPDSRITGFAVSKEAYGTLRGLDCERSIQFNFFRARQFFTEDEVNAQLSLFKKTFGETPICSANHAWMWSGWADFPRWCWNRGMKGDASRAHHFLIPDANPVNTFGFGFGTAFPHFVMDDWIYQNRLMDYVYMPMMFYEPRISQSTERKDKSQIKRIIDKAKASAWLMSCFFHPMSLVRDPDCQKALTYLLNYIVTKKYRVLYIGTDSACLWWHSRNKSSVLERDGTYLVHASYKDGIVVRFPDRPDATCLLDGKPVKMEHHQMAGRDCRLVVVPSGDHCISLNK